MKTTTAKKQAITIGMDLGDRKHAYCVLDGEGEVIREESVANRREALAELARSGFVVNPSTSPEIGIPTRDPEGVPIVSFAVAGPADVLVTGDRDLLDIAQLPIRVVSPSGFRTQQQA